MALGRSTLMSRTQTNSQRNLKRLRRSFELGCYARHNQTDPTPKGDTLTAIGKAFVAVLSTNERGPAERRKAGTRLQAFAAARTPLNVAERRDWNRGEAIMVEVRQTDE